MAEAKKTAVKYTFRCGEFFRLLCYCAELQVLRDGRWVAVP